MARLEGRPMSPMVGTWIEIMDGAEETASQPSQRRRTRSTVNKEKKKRADENNNTEDGLQARRWNTTQRSPVATSPMPSTSTSMTSMKQRGRQTPDWLRQPLSYLALAPPTVLHAGHAEQPARDL